MACVHTYTLSMMFMTSTFKHLEGSCCKFTWVTDSQQLEICIWRILSYLSHSSTTINLCIYINNITVGLFLYLLKNDRQPPSTYSVFLVSKIHVVVSINGGTPNGWFILLKWTIWGYPFQETSMYCFRLRHNGRLSTLKILYKHLNTVWDPETTPESSRCFLTNGGGCCKKRSPHLIHDDKCIFHVFFSFLTYEN